MSQQNRFRPFCSERCQMIDLGTWVSGDYENEPTDASDHEHPADHQEHPDPSKKGRILH